jgi:hypothetical protein
MSRCPTGAATTTGGSRSARHARQSQPRCGGGRSPGSLAAGARALLTAAPHRRPPSPIVQTEASAFALDRRAPRRQARGPTGSTAAPSSHAARRCPDLQAAPPGRSRVGCVAQRARRGGVQEGLRRQGHVPAFLCPCRQGRRLPAQPAAGQQRSGARQRERVLLRRRRLTRRAGASLGGGLVGHAPPPLWA